VLRTAAIYAAAALALSEGQAADPLPIEKVYAAIVSIEPRDGEYDGYYCPPEDPNDEGETICLGASILIQRGAIEGFIGARPDKSDPWIKAAHRTDVDGAYVRLRMIAGHARRRVPAGRYLAVLEPTDKGYFYLQWYESVREAKGCFPSHLVEHYGARLELQQLKPATDGGRCI
jgi:hypothetical protein